MARPYQCKLGIVEIATTERQNCYLKVIEYSSPVQSCPLQWLTNNLRLSSLVAPPVEVPDADVEMANDMPGTDE